MEIRGLFIFWPFSIAPPTGEELRARQNNVPYEQNNVPYEHYDVRVVWMNATNKADYSCVSSVS